MKAGAGKAKGAEFERFACKRLSMWLSKGMRDDLFWRSAMSGGRATLQLNKEIVNKAQSGDLTAIGSEAYVFAEGLFIECKHYQDLQFGRGFICKSGMVWDFWRIACKEAARYDKTPLLIARQNRYPVVVITRSTRAIFGADPMIVLSEWQAEVCLFEIATTYKRPPMTRRAA